MIIDLVDIRKLEQSESECNFVMHSWLKSHRDQSKYHRNIPYLLYYAGQQAGIKKTMENSECLIASPKGEPGIIVGYLVYEDRGSDDYVILHYCYVKNKFRRMGLADHLIAEISKGRKLLASHYTSKIRNLTFNPYFFRTEWL